MRKKHLFLTVLLFLCLGFLQAHAQKTILIKDTEQALNIGKQVRFFEDETGSMGLQEILKAENLSKFQVQTAEAFNHPATPSIFWFEFSAQNLTGHPLWLEINSTLLWYIDFYSPDSLGRYLDPIQTGSLRSFDGQLKKGFSFCLPLGADSLPKYYYLSVRGDMPLEVPLYIGTGESLYKKGKIEDFLSAGFIGVAFIMFLYNLFILISTRERIYLIYLLYLLFTSINALFLNNRPVIEDLTADFISKDFWHTHFLVWHTPAWVFIAWFCIDYLNLFKKMPWTAKLIVAVTLLTSVVYPLLILIGVRPVLLTNSFQIVCLVLQMLCIWAGYYLALKRDKKAYFYLIGWTFLIIGISIFLLTINGFIPYNPYTRNAMYLGIGLEIWMFSLAMSAKIKLLQQEKELQDQTMLGKLQESEERNQQIFDNALDAFIVIDERSHILQWSKRSEEIFGWRAEEVMGKSLSEIIIPPKYREAHKNGHQRFMATRNPKIMNQIVEISAIRKNGEEFPVELLVNHLEKDGLITFHSFIRDISQKKQAQEELNLSQKQHLNALEENRKLVIEQNIMLEKKVEERTLKLQETNEELKTILKTVNQQNEEITAQKEEISSALEAVEKERQKSDELLLNILPQATAYELKEKGYATTKRYEQVSVLFTDFKGFTQISEGMSPEKVVENLDYCFQAFDDIVKKHGIEKIKTIGDAYMCAGGVPVADTDNAQRTLAAALEMKDFMAKWKAEKEAKGEKTWEVRIGIHTGPVVAGVVGKDKFAYDIWGDTVNTASRMESSGEAGQVNISDATHKLLAKSGHQFTYRGELEAKGKGKVGMWFVA